MPKHYRKDTDESATEEAIHHTDKSNKESSTPEILEELFSSDENISTDNKNELTDNSGLQEKINFLLDIGILLNKKNKGLSKSNWELQQQKVHCDQLAKELKSKLDELSIKEKELSLQRDFLIKQVDEKTQDLIQSEKFTVIGELATRLVHDLRNPLSIIKNSLEIMSVKHTMKEEDRLEHFGRIDRAIQKITYQIDDVLNYVKKSELVQEQTFIMPLIDSAINNILIPTGVKIAKPRIDTIIQCDPRKMEAVFSNLMNNSIQAMNNTGEIIIRILDLGNKVQIEIEDTGPGMPLDIQQKVFEPLFTTKKTGTGLGLAICKNIIEQHGGTITVSSPPTVFSLRLPKNTIRDETKFESHIT